MKLPACFIVFVVGKGVIWSICFCCCIFYQQTGQLDLKHFDPEFVREPVPGMTSLVSKAWAWLLSI